MGVVGIGWRAAVNEEFLGVWEPCFEIPTTGMANSQEQAAQAADDLADAEVARDEAAKKVAAAGLEAAAIDNLGIGD